VKKQRKRISLLPYDNEYILIHKRALFVNNYALSLLCQFIKNSSIEQKKVVEQHSYLQIMEIFTEMAIVECNKLSDDLINKITLEGVTQANNPNDIKPIIQVNFDS
jgi:hypothetical protein